MWKIWGLILVNNLLHSSYTMKAIRYERLSLKGTCSPCVLTEFLFCFLGFLGLFVMLLVVLLFLMYHTVLYYCNFRLNLSKEINAVDWHWTKKAGSHRHPSFGGKRNKLHLSSSTSGNAPRMLLAQPGFGRGTKEEEMMPPKCFWLWETKDHLVSAQTTPLKWEWWPNTMFQNSSAYLLKLDFQNL